MNFIQHHNHLTPISLSGAPHGMQHCFYHNATHGVAMLVFSSFDTITETINTLIEHIWKSTPPKNEEAATQILSIILNIINVKLSTKSILVAPNHVLREGGFIDEMDTTTLVCDLPEEKYIDHIYLFIKEELQLRTLKNLLISGFNTHHVSILINLLLSLYSKTFVTHFFSIQSEEWLLSRTNGTSFHFYNPSNDHSFSIFRGQHENYIVNKAGTIEVGKALAQLNRMEEIVILYCAFVQHFSEANIDSEIISSISVIKYIPDIFINALSNTNLVELMRRPIHLYGLDSQPFYGTSLFYETLTLSMESLHRLLLSISYLGDLPTPQFAHYQIHYHKCFNHEINIYVAIGRMAALSICDKHASCPHILSAGMIKALFIFNSEDLKINHDISYEKLKTTIDWQKEGNKDQYREKINNIANEALKALTLKRRREIARILFLLFPNILYKQQFSTHGVSVEEELIIRKVITQILLRKKGVLVNNSKQVILMIEKLIDKYHFGDTEKVLSYIKKKDFTHKETLSHFLEEITGLIVQAIENVYMAFIEPLFLIAWGTYLYSKMQRSHDSNNKYDHRLLNTYISMVGKYDGVFDNMDIMDLPSVEKIKYEKDILSLLGDPFDNNIISKLKTKISGFHDYHTLSKDDIDRIVITKCSLPTVDRKRSWICEYLEKASYEERKWFFRFFTNTPHVDPREILICVSGSSIFSNSKIVYANSCLNNLVVGLTYHVECHNQERNHYFFEKIKDIKQLFPNEDVVKKAKESFFKDLSESLYSYKNFLESNLSEITANKSSGPFMVVKRHKKYKRFQYEVIY